MSEIFHETDVVDFGALPAAVDELLQQGVIAYRHDRARADTLFREALAVAPRELAAYYCLYKIHTYMGNLDIAANVARDGLREAATQAGWATDPTSWPRQEAAGASAARFALFTLKALSFIELKRGNRNVALTNLRILASIDPSDSLGWSVIHALAQGIS